MSDQSSSNGASQAGNGAHNAQNPPGDGADGAPKVGRGSPPLHTRWKPGQSGNPGGRPKGESVTARLRKVLEQEHNGRVLLDLLAERLAKEALAGKFPFVKEVLDRLDGPVNQKHQVAVERMPVEEYLAGLTDDELIGMAVRVGRVDSLPPELRERAQRQGLYTPPPVNFGVPTGGRPRAEVQGDSHGRA